MARRGSKKDLSVRHEEKVAAWYCGVRSPTSGASDTDDGDVRSDGTLFECKYTGSPAQPLKRRPTIIKQMEKIADEAWSEYREPALALRFYWPGSPLADQEGWVDFVVRLLDDDAGNA